MALVGLYYAPPKRECARCGNTKPHHAHGLCHSCYENGRRPYKPTGTGRGGPGIGRSRRIITDRLTDYQRLRRAGKSIEAAARDLGLSARSGYRYEARLKTA